MVTTRAAVLAGIAALLLLACGAATPQETPDNGVTSPGSVGASSHSGGGGGGGGAGSQSAGSGGKQAADNSGTPSAGSAGRQASGGSGAASSNGCHDVSECPSTMPGFGTSMCLTPGQSPPSPGCGVQTWCGKCSCPPQPQAPTGTGMACQTNQDCPQPTAAAPVVASVCSDGNCTACAQNSDCPTSAPVCESSQTAFNPANPVQPMSYRACTVCAADTDCPNDRPHCQGSDAGTACVACRTTSDCADGVCSGGACVPGCGPAQACGQAMECTPQHRCEALSCQVDADCLKNQACTAGHCARRTCASDAACDGNCVNGSCFEALGTCFVFVPAV
ncbi:MAG: hypothetical protein ABI488_06185 [Polyangiaceae bacterium]